MHGTDKVWGAFTIKMGFCIHLSLVVDYLVVVERLFWPVGRPFSGRCRCGEVAVIERLK